MFADMVGYTSLTQKDELLALRMLNELGNLLRPILREHAGREIKTMGDAFLVEFGSALEAAQCALEIQDNLGARNKKSSLDERILVRMGIHLGDVEQKNGDIFGDAVNIASRLEPLCEPGGVCISQQLYDQIQNNSRFSFKKVGKRRLKNVKAPLIIYEILVPSK
jgi:class 3 adenylate cyclase